MSEFLVEHAPWTILGAPASSIRHEVFVIEQRVPAELEMDALDALSLHVLARLADGTPVGTGRLLPDGHIGRMAVRQPWRGHGIGGGMLARLIELAAERGDTEVVLNAQLSALPFYLKFGFLACGEDFVEAGIVHREMRRPLR